MVAIPNGVNLANVLNHVEMDHKIGLEIVQTLNRNTVEGIVLVWDQTLKYNTAIHIIVQ